MRRSRDRQQQVAVAEAPLCAACRRALTGQGASWWWCSEECFYEWQRTRYSWTA